jgi:hypothetical protein
MPAIIDSAPDCVQNVAHYVKGDEADFILQSAYEKCAGIMTFGPGTTYGEGGSAATSSYYVLTIIGMVVTAAAIVAWVIVEHRRLKAHVTRLNGTPVSAQPPHDPPPPAAGTTL